jgi:hypothetical protein
MKKIISLALVLTFATISFAQTANENLWIGKYAHENDVGKEYFMLEVFRDGDKLKGRYKETVSDQTTAKFTLSIEIKGNTASFYVAECLPLSKSEKDDGGNNNCGGDYGHPYAAGAVILKLKRVSKGKTVSVKTLFAKYADMFAGELYFEKTKKFYDSF